jgi:hypothetical protein
MLKRATPECDLGRGPDKGCARSKIEGRMATHVAAPEVFGIRTPNSTAQLARLSRPITSGLVHRPRLFGRLKCISARGVGWVYGPADSGKTSLLATWIEQDGRRPLWYRVEKEGSDASDRELALRREV